MNNVPDVRYIKTMKTPINLRSKKHKKDDTLITRTYLRGSMLDQVNHMWDLVPMRHFH